MKILVACEFSGIVREAFTKLGHDAWSCDLIDTEIPGKHLIGDVLNFLDDKWDMLIAHPPCTYLAVSGARYFKQRQKEQQQAIEFARKLWEAPIDKICMENPISVLSTKLCKPSQIIQPWQFGHGETKATCLWLKNLPLLQPTNIVSGREPRILNMAPGPNRKKERSRTYAGIAEAMAKQWGT